MNDDDDYHETGGMVYEGYVNIESLVEGQNHRGWKGESERE